MRTRPGGWSLKLLRRGYLLAVAVAVIPFGSVYGQLIALACGLFASLALASAFRPLRPELQPAALWATVLVALLAGWALLQGSSLAGVNPAWAAAAEALGGSRGLPPGSLSISPHMGFIGLANLLLPALAFVTGLVLFQDDAAVLQLMHGAALLALAGALLGIYEFAAAPNQLLFLPRVYPMDGVTAFFVNRNTAATFLGFGTILWGSLLLSHLKEVGLSGLKAIAIETGARHRAQAMQILVLFLFFLAMVVALFLTKSRAGISASLIGLMVMSIGLLRSNVRDVSPLSRIAPVMGTIALVLAIVALYGGQFLTRVSGADIFTDGRWCFFSDIASAIRLYPLTGTGYGSLLFAYPAQRSPGCFPLDLTLDRGHNGYLELTMGMGLPALVVTLIGIMYLGFVLASGTNQRRSMRLCPAAAMGVLTLAVIHTALDFSLQIPGVAVFFAAILAAGVVASRPQTSRGHRTGSKRTGAPRRVGPEVE